MRAVERSPQDSCGLHAGGPAALDVVARVAHEHGAGGRRAQSLERGKYRLGMRLGMGDFVRADDHLEGVLEPGDAEPAHGAAPHLTGHEPERLALVPQRQHRLDHAGIGAHQLVVVGEVVRAVSRYHGLDLGGVLGEVAELHPQRGAEPLHPDVVGRLVPAVQAHRVAVGAEDQLDGVDERAVEVEKESGERHAGR